MSLRHSPSIVMNGLVLYQDMFNLKKSWKGAPTTNQYANSNVISLWTTKSPGIASIVDNAALAPDGTFTASLLTTSGTSNSYVANGGTVVSGNTYTRSIYAKAGTTSTLIFEAYDNNGSGGQGYFTTFFDLTAGTVASSAAGNIASIEALPDGWYRCVMTRTYSFNTSGGTLYIGAYGKGVGNMYLWGGQFEQGAMVTPLVITKGSAASRSATEALLDLTGKNTLNAVSLTYNSNNTFSFNGTTNYIDCGNNTVLQQAAAITLSAWVKPVTSTGLGNIMSKNMNSGYRFRVQNGQLWWYVSGNLVLGGSCPDGAWSHCTVTGDSGGLKAYVNGELVASNAVAYAPTAVATGSLHIGCYYNGHEHFNGQIATASLYSRALTAAEVNQNFNATRGRFGL